jgi:hypothetical protein
MKLLIIQPVADPRTKRYPYRHAVALLAATLRRQGYGVSLLVTDGQDEGAIAATVTDTAPLLMLIYVDSLAADLAYRIADALRSVRAVPLILFGPHATLCPNDCLSMSGVEAVALGPADLSIRSYLRSRGQGPEFLRTAGLWVNRETGVMRNPPARPPQSLAAQPLPARDLYEEVLDAAGYAEVRIARGGEAGEASDDLPPTPEVRAAWPGAADWPMMLRPVKSVLEEMNGVADDYLDLAGFRVTNERWASIPLWLAEFAPRYRSEVNLPLRTTLYAADVSDRAAALLKDAGCEEVRIRVGSGSTFIRNEILGLHTLTEELEAAFAALRRARLPTAASVEIGAPYETSVTLEETLAVLKRLDPDRVEAALHWPAPGSHAHKVAKENGWLVPDAPAACLEGRPALALPSLSEEQLVTAAECLPYQIVRPRLVPLIRLTRRVKIGEQGSVYDLIVKPFLAPPVRRQRRT